MILPRNFPASAPPDPRTRQANIPSLLFSWWCTGCALVIILFRLVGRMVRNDMLFREDKIMFASIIPLFIRMGLVHVILLFGTNNVKIIPTMTAEEMHRRAIGSRLVLASRIFYAMFIWMTKWTICEFLKRLTRSFWRTSYERFLRGIRIFLIATFIAVVIGTLAECQPFDHYWQVNPDPGPQCRQGWTQLITMGVADTITDLVLIGFPTFIVIRSNFGYLRKISLILLFSISIIPCVITIYRVPAVVSKHSRQQYRTVWASGEILAAAAVANAIVLGSFLRDRGVKKQKYRPDRTLSATDSMSHASTTPTRRPTLTQQTLGSDEELFRGMCYRPSDATNYKPMAMRTATGPIDLATLGAKDWQFPDDEHARDSEDSDTTRAGALDVPSRYDAEAMPSPGDTTGMLNNRRRVSFFDVGGILELGEGGVVDGGTAASDNSGSTLAPSSTSGTSIQDFAAVNSTQPGPARPARALTREPLEMIQGSPRVLPQGRIANDPSSPTLAGAERIRKGSEIPSLKDIGGLLPPDNLTNTMSLGDVGGLLDSRATSPENLRRNEVFVTPPTSPR